MHFPTRSASSLVSALTLLWTENPGCLQPEIFSTSSFEMSSSCIHSPHSSNLFASQEGQNTPGAAGEHPSPLFPAQRTADALTATSVGTLGDGMTAMNNATECGVWGGLYEVAKVSLSGMRVESAIFSCSLFRVRLLGRRIGDGPSCPFCDLRIRRPRTGHGRKRRRNPYPSISGQKLSSAHP